jgi:hypothetical protein
MRYLYLMFFPFILLASQEEQLAEAFFAAHAYEMASQFYDQKLSESPPQWQLPILLYNLGTIKLAQNQWNQAQKNFDAIKWNDLASPQLLPQLLAQQGVLELRQATSNDVEQKRYLIQSSQQYFRAAKRASCAIQQLQDPLLLSCPLPFELNLLSAQVNFELRQISHVQRAALLHIHAATLLKKGLERLLNFWEIPDQLELQNTYLTYFLQSSQTLMPLWDILRPSGTEQIAAFENAFKFYLTALKALQQKDQKSAYQAIKEAKSALDSVENQVQEIWLDYHLLLTQSQLLLPALQQLKQKTLLENDVNLDQSIEALQKEQTWVARIFLTLSLYAFEDQFLQNTHPQGPYAILQHALITGQRALNLNRLLQLAHRANMTPEIQPSIVKLQQQAVTKADPFIAAALTQSKEAFSQLGQQSCQQSTWEQTIPLFEKGYQSATLAADALDKNLAQKALPEQETMVLAWQKALKILQNPPLKEQNRSSDTNQVLQNLEEMQLNDGLRKMPSSKEILQW